MEERGKHKIMIGIEVVLLCMIMTIIGTNTASSNPPSNGVSYSKNSQTTVEGALNDLYNKANYGNATAAQILKGKTALVGGKKVTGTYEAPSLASQTSSATAGAGDILKDKTAYVNGSKITGSMTNKGAVTGTINPGGEYTIPAGYHNGSGKATCSTCESNGYYKLKKFEKVKATVESYQTFDGSWKHLSKHEVTSNNSVGSVSKFKINLKNDLGINSTEIVDYTIIFTCNNSIRFTRGYEQNSSTVAHWYPEGGRLVVTKEGNNSFGLFENNTLNSTLHSMDAYISGSDIGVEFSTTRFTDSNGTTQGAFETKCTEFYLSGSIIYK